VNWADLLLWGFAGTVAMTTLLVASLELGLTRMSVPYLLGTMVCADRDRARLVGIGLHLVNGWLFAVIYALAFESWGRATWWLGAAVGLVHVAFVLVVAIPMLPAVHPRMASEAGGPTPTRQLEPPGFMARHYGRRTPVAAVLSHLLFGAILGAFYNVT
jgi:hypothetical protein